MMILQAEVEQSISIRVNTPDGVMYLTIVEDEYGRPYHIDITAGKCGNSFSTWAVAMCDILSYMLKNRYANISTIISLLSEHNSDKIVMSQQGTIVKSGVQGIKSGLIQYLQYKHKDEQPDRGFAPRIQSR